MDDTPTVEVSGTPKPDVQNTTNSAFNEVEMGGTHETPNPQTESTEKPEQTATATEDIILIDVQNEPEPPTPAKKSEGFKFLE
jgi:hypothetical protein